MAVDENSWRDTSHKTGRPSGHVTGDISIQINSINGVNTPRVLIARCLRSSGGVRVVQRDLREFTVL